MKKIIFITSLFILIGIILFLSRNTIRYQYYNNFVPNTVIDTIKIQFTPANFTTIKKNLINARKSKNVVLRKGDYINCNLFYLKDTIAALSRLKGDLKDHYSQRFSLRIKSKSPKIKTNTFSLQAPRTRNGIYEWLIQNIMKNENILGLDYNFNHVVIQNKYKGIYAFEEHPGGNYLNKRNLNGCVLKFSESTFWKNSQKTKYVSKNNEVAIFNSAKIKIFKSDTKPSKQLKDLAIAKLDSFRNGLLQFEDAFNIEKTTKFFAINEIMGSHHALRWHNSRYYFDPVTEKLEPISFDHEGGIFSGKLFYQDKFLLHEYQKLFYNNQKFKERYLSHLKHYLENKTILKYIQKYNSEIIKFHKLLIDEERYYSKRRVLQNIDQLKILINSSL